MEVAILGIIIAVIVHFIRKAHKNGGGFSFGFSRDPFRYIWSISALNEKYNDEKQKKPNDRDKIDQLYQDAAQRINTGQAKARNYLPGFLEEVEHVLGYRRSIEPLRKKTWEFVERLAVLAGYSSDEVENEDFFCPVLNELWEIYHKNKNRIFKRNQSSVNDPTDAKTQSSYDKTFLDRKKHFFREALYELKRCSSRAQLRQSYDDSVYFFKKYGAKFNWEFSGSVEDIALKALFEALWDTLPNEENSKTSHESRSKSKEQSSNQYQEGKSSQQSHSYTSQKTKESIREKNSRIFDGIWDITELKKKYRKLAKLDHPDCGGNHKAMQALNEYYARALERIQAAESAYI